MSTNQPYKNHFLKNGLGTWRMWDWVCVRGAGLVATTVLTLVASPKVLEISEALWQAEDEAEQLRHQAVLALHEKRNQCPPEQLPIIQTALRKLYKQQLPPLTLVDLPILAELHALRQRIDTWQAEFVQHMVADAPRLSQAIRTALQNESFQEAIIWQNRQAYHQRVEWFLRQPSHKSDQRIRETERLLANYLQRYCVKNDTIGFFGPVGWGKLSADEVAITYQPGQTLLARRHLYVEHWGVEVLAQTFGQIAELRPWLPPRLLPFFYVEGTTLHLPMVTNWLRQGSLPFPLRDTFELSPTQYRLLQLCDGQRLARDIARELLADLTLNLTTEAEVYQLLDQLANLGVLRWTLEIPLTLDAMETLRHRLNQITDSALQQPLLTALDQLTTAQAKVAQAAGQAEQLNQAIGELEDTFTQLTGVSAQRAAGKYYAGRTLVYEDCQRDMTMTLGTEFLARLGAPLSLLLTSARWFTYRVAQQYRASFTTIYEQLAQQIGSPIIDFYSFSLQALPLLQNENCPQLDMVTRELQQHWANILTNCSQTQVGNEKNLIYRSQDLQAQVEAIFGAPHPGWNLARYRSPDIMIAAPSVEAMQRGDYQLILGELHLFNTLARACLVAQHPNPSELFAIREQDIPEPGLVPLPSPEWNTQRATIALVSPQDIWLAYDATPPPHHSPINQSVAIGELVVEQTDKGLQIRTRDRRLNFDIIEFFGYTLSNKVMAFPAILPPRNHQPRLTIDEVVIARESWCFNVSELPFAELKDSSAQFLAAHRWAKTHGLPRFLFVKSPNEPKPFYVDLSSPVYVSILAQTARRLADSEMVNPIRLTEMLPTFDQIWLNDAIGQRYTSELRLVALDSF